MEATARGRPPGEVRHGRGVRPAGTLARKVSGGAKPLQEAFGPGAPYVFQFWKRRMAHVGAAVPAHIRGEVEAQTLHACETRFEAVRDHFAFEVAMMDYLDGELPPEDRAALEAHFVTCPPCVAFLCSYKETPRILREAPAPPIPEEVRERLALFPIGKKRS